MTTIQDCNCSLDLSPAELKMRAQKFAPIVYLFSDDDTRPSGVDWYLSRVNLCFEKDSQVVLNVGEITPQNLVTQMIDGYSSGAREFNPDKFTWYLRIPEANGDVVRHGEPVQQNIVNTPCYAHVRRAKDSTAVDIQYWFFYPYNGDIEPGPASTGTHDGDWEHVTVRTDPNMEAILGVFYARHGDEAKWCTSDECKCYVEFYQAHKYDAGRRSAVAYMKDGTIVEVHNGGNNGNLYYRLGRLANGGKSLTWLTGDGGQKYDKGDRPAVAIAPSGTIVEVHNGGDNGNLYYRLGRLTNGGTGITWLTGDGGQKYDKGDRPALAITPDGTIVEVHNGGDNGNLYYRLGRLTNGDMSITWLTGDKGQKYDKGNHPAVAIAPDGAIVEVHNGGDNNNLYYRLGRLTNGGKNITWLTGDGGQKYDAGDQPSVAIMPNGIIVEIHNGGSNNHLYYRLARLANNGAAIQWFTGEGGIQYDSGSQPSVLVTNDGVIIEVHDGSGNGDLYYNTGRLLDNPVPVVYSAKRSHASYWTTGTHSRIADDYTDRGPIWKTRDHLVMLNDDPSADVEAPWNQFAGRWGSSKATGPFESKSPETPGFKGSWCDDGSGPWA